MSFLKGWRTHIVMGLIGLSGILDALGALDLKSYLADIGLTSHQVGMITLGIAVLGIILRQITTTPPGKSQ